jgi:hypothetical protein
MLSAALLISAFTWSAGRASSSALSSAEVDRRIQQAVYASESRQTAKTTQLVHDLAQKADTEHQLRQVAESNAEYARKQAYALEVKNGEYVTPASN